MVPFARDLKPLNFISCPEGDDEGTDVEPGDVGEFLIRGPIVMKGYFRQLEATAAVLVDGWFHTGDLARTMDGGFYEFVGRKKNIIKSHGVNHPPGERNFGDPQDGGRDGCDYHRDRGRRQRTTTHVGSSPALPGRQQRFDISGSLSAIRNWGFQVLAWEGGLDVWTFEPRQRGHAM